MIDISAAQKYLEDIDYERRNRWITCGHKLEVIDQLLNVTFQGLATVDARLAKEDKKIINGEPISNPFGDLSEHLHQSYLWVLGSYEVIRTLSQFSDLQEINEFSSRKEDIRKLKHEFEKVRIPLAKFEAAKRNPNGYPFAYPIQHAQDGTGWLIGENSFVTRLNLSTMFLELAESLP